MAASNAILVRLLTAALCCALASGLQPSTFWNPLRFLQQSSRFVQFPGTTGSSTTVTVNPGDVLYQGGNNAQNEFDFAPLDDVVMGGASKSTFSSGIWRGTVTDANNGGFIGIRSIPSGKTYDCTACQGFQVKVRLLRSPGNSRVRFKFATRDSADFNGLTWATSVDATVMDKSAVWKVPLAKQKATQFARVVPNQQFKLDTLVGVQFVYSKFEYDGDLNLYFALGEIELEIEEIKAY